MQLNRCSSIRAKLSTAAWLLLASGAPVPAKADSGVTTQLDASLLMYGEKSRTKVVEPLVRVTRLYPDGQALSAQIGIDVMTGATPNGTLPSGGGSQLPPDDDGAARGGPAIQTVTAASGGGEGEDPGRIPLASFSDARFVLDADWQKPFGLITPVVSGHFSREQDYQSLGASGKLSVELMHRLTTLTVGAGLNHDNVFPSHGTHLALSDSNIIIGKAWNPKRVQGGLVGVSRILTRRWMVAVNGSISQEKGYLTEPYKVVSLMDPSTGVPVGELTEKRPSRRQRRDVLESSVYHLVRDVIYLSHRYYWDDWGVRSNTFDLKYRHELEDSMYVQPHLRYYAQTPADFFRFGLIQGAPLPSFVSSDERLGPLRTMTVGGTLGFALPNTPGEWSVRAEYIRQFGKGHPDYVVGVQRDFDLFPPVNIGSLVVAYSVPL